MIIITLSIIYYTLAKNWEIAIFYYCNIGMLLQYIFKPRRI